MVTLVAGEVVVPATVRFVVERDTVLSSFRLLTENFSQKLLFVRPFRLWAAS